MSVRAESDQSDRADYQGVEVVVEGAGRDVEVGRYVRALSDTVWLLSQIDRLALRQAPRLKWTVAATSSNGVFRATLMPRAIPSKRPAATSHIPAQGLVEGLTALKERPEIPDLFTEQSVQRVEKFGEPTGGLKAVRVAPVLGDGEIGASVSIDEVVREHARSAIAPQESSIGSVTGLLDVLNARHKLRASLYNPRTRRAVTCIVPNTRGEEVTRAFGHRVLVGGPLVRNELGQVIHIELREFEVLPDDFRAPTVDDILGIDPDWTGGRSTEEYLTRVRGA